MKSRNIQMHLLRRVLFFLLGILLFYAPFAVLVRALLWATDSPLIADAHRVCLRMPFEWLLQPWMYPVFLKMPLFFIGLLLLPLIALFLGPLFCGWLCPAGSFPELVGRLIPDRYKLSLGRKLNPAPIRYGVFVGMLISPFVGGYICCTYCNFTMMQHLVNAVTGRPEGLLAWSSFTIVTFVLWLFVLGIFVKGGRGFCNFLCPAGAVQGLAHALGRRLRSSRSIQIDHTNCKGCGACEKGCPAWAIQKGQVNLHACNLCRDCIAICPQGSISYDINAKR